MSDKVDKYFNEQMAREVVGLMNSTKDPEAFSRFGKFLGVRQYGSTPHIELMSDSPGNSGFEKIVIYEEDIPAAFEVFSALSKRVELRRAAEKAEMEASEGKSKKKAGGKNNANVPDSESARAV